MYNSIKLIEEEGKKVKYMWMCFYSIYRVITLLHYHIEPISRPWGKTYLQIIQALINAARIEASRRNNNFATI